MGNIRMDVSASSITVALKIREATVFVLEVKIHKIHTASLWNRDKRMSSNSPAVNLKFPKVLMFSVC